MADYQEIMVSVPSNLLQELDGLVMPDRGYDRSVFVMEALQRYIDEKKRRAIREELKQGYLEMAHLNLQLAEEGLGDGRIAW